MLRVNIIIVLNFDVNTEFRRKYKTTGKFLIYLNKLTYNQDYCFIDF